MKRSVVFMMLLLLCVLMFGGCAKEEGEVLKEASGQAGEFTPFSGQKPDDAPDAPPEGMGPGQFSPGDFPGNLPAEPDFPMDEKKEMDGSGSTGESFPGQAPVVDEEKLFTDRDLNSSPDLSDAVMVSAKSKSNYTIDTAGIYVLTGEAEDFTVIVEADKKDKVQLVLKDLQVTNVDFPVIYVKSADKCFVTLSGDNALSVEETFVSDGDIHTDAVIFSKDDLTLNGDGSLTILSAAGNGISCKDDLRITGGKYDVTSALDAIEANDSIAVYDGAFVITSNKDAFHCENDEGAGFIYMKDGSYTISAKSDGIQATSFLMIQGGDFEITASEGLEATYVQINGGNISINASDDGINAARKGSEYDVVIEINGGEITIVMGPGDTDGLDANGTIIVNGGTIDVSGMSTFDADNGSVYNGGTIIINGVVSDTIPESMMGGGGHGGKGGKWSGDGGKGFRKRH